MMFMNFNFHVPKSLQNLNENGSVVNEKSEFNFHVKMTLSQGQEMTLTFNTHISSLTQLVSSQRFLKNPLFSLFPIEKPKLQTLTLP